MLQWLVGLGIFLVLMFYVVAPLIVMSQLRLRRTIGESDVPPEASKYVRTIASNLRDEQFVASRIYHVPGPSPAVASFCSLLVSRTLNCTALATTTYNGSQVKAQYLECMSRLADGRVVLTNNSSELSAFVDNPGRDVLYSPGVVSPSVLVRIHQQRVARILGARPAVVLPNPGDEPAFITLAIDELLSHQVKSGLLRESPNGLRLTLYGAYRLTWAELPPFKQVRRMRANARARRELVALGFDPRSAA